MFAKTMNGKIWIVFSINDPEEDGKPGTMDLIPQSQWTDPKGGYDPEYIICTNVNVNEVIMISDVLSEIIM